MFGFFIKMFLIVFIVLIQTSFLTGWGYPLENWQLFLSFLTVILLIFEKTKKLLGWILILGIILGFYSAYPSFLITISLILTFLSINFLFNNFFTNRSWYSLVSLNIFATIFYNSLARASKYLYDILYSATNTWNLSLFLSALLWQTILNLIGAILIFVIFKKFYGKKYFSRF